MNKHTIFLWSHPRSLSTAFERAFLERKDCITFHEPFSVPFFFGPERRHDRFANHPISTETFTSVLVDIDAKCQIDGFTFVKDHAFHVIDNMDMSLFKDATHSFIVRDPQKALRSFHKKLPDFDWLEAGYESLLEMFYLVTREFGHQALVVNADRLQTNPHEVMKRYCDAISVPFLPEALRWESKKVDAWMTWEGWHDDAQFSNGIHPCQAEDINIPRLPVRVEEAIRRARPLFEELVSHSI